MRSVFQNGSRSPYSYMPHIDILKEIEKSLNNKVKKEILYIKAIKIKHVLKNLISKINADTARAEIQINAMPLIFIFEIRHTCAQH